MTSPRRNPKSENGSSMAWMAVFLAAVLLPLMTLVVDGSRLVYVRSRIQAAADAACEDAAWSAADRRLLRDTGRLAFQSEGYILTRAQSTFEQTLSDQVEKQFFPVLEISLDYDNLQVYCAATASVPLTVLWGQTHEVAGNARSAIRVSGP